jgi:O-antigen/teichoic acid export membrane protein
MTGALKSTVRRVAKTASAVAGGQAAFVLSQVLLPPAFLSSYGVTVYGEWLALSAGAAWLLSLDFGMQAFITNQLSLEYFAGNLPRLRRLQSVGLRISVAVVLTGLLLAGGLIWLVPLNKALGLSMSREVASSIGICLVLQVLVGILWGQLNGVLRAIGYPHRAEIWGQSQRLLYFVVTYALVLRRAPLWWLPLTQLASFLVMATVSLTDLKRLEPRAFPTLRYWDPETAKEVLKPSLWFGSFTLNQFLLFQVPILVLNQMVGKQAVVVFSICRGMYGLVRQGLATFRYAMRPEITRLAGLNEWLRLRRVYSMYERFSFAASIIASALAFVAAPRILFMWTRRSDMFSAPLYAAMMLCTIVVLGKDTRLDLQYATNRHVRSAMLCLFTYVLFAIGCVPAARLGGAVGIAVAWAAVEIIQMIWMHSENQKIVPSLSYWSLLKLCACGLGGVAIFLPIQQTLASSMLPRFALLLVVLAGGLVVCTSLIFRLGDAVDQIALGLGLTSRGQGA